MELIADGLLLAAALTAALYCWILSRRLSALKRMDKGLGGAIAGLSARVEQTKASLADTKASTGDITRELSALTARAEIAAGRLEILLSTLQDRPSNPSRRADRVEDDLEEEEEVAVETREPVAAEADEPMRAPAESRKSDVVSALRRIARARTAP